MSAHGRTDWVAGRRVVLVVGLYAVAFLGWFFGLGANASASPALAIAVFVGANFGLGIWIGRVWTLALPLLILLLSLPVANVRLFDESGTFLDMAVLLGLIAAVAILAGLAVRWLGWPRSKLPQIQKRDPHA